MFASNKKAPPEDIVNAQNDRESRQNQRDHRQDQREERQDERHNSDSDISALKERLTALERWQTAQNGTLQRLEAKVDTLIMWMMGATFAALVAVIGCVINLLSGHPPTK